MNTNYFVVPAPGWYGDETEVISSHKTLKAALRAANRENRIARVGNKQKGARFSRASEDIYPAAKP